VKLVLCKLATTGECKRQARCLHGCAHQAVGTCTVAVGCCGHGAGAICRPLKSRTLWQVVSDRGTWMFAPGRTRAEAIVNACLWATAWRNRYRQGWRAIKTTQVEG
jgi:hypothetical protein